MSSVEVVHMDGKSCVQVQTAETCLLCQLDGTPDLLPTWPAEHEHRWAKLVELLQREAVQ